MRPTFKPDGLKKAKFWEYAVRFAFGGLVTVFAAVVAEAHGPAIGGLLLAFPAIRFVPAGMLWLDMALFAVIGFFVYTPVLFSGVISLDLTTKKAVGTAAGFVGFFGYVGRVIEDKGLGWIADHYGWDAGIYAVLACTIVAIILLAFTWNVRPRG